MDEILLSRRHAINLPSKAIARAVYSRKPVAIFDDVFSGLDKATEQAVFTQVFGRDGLLRRNGTTVVLATHAGKPIFIFISFRRRR